MEDQQISRDSILEKLSAASGETIGEGQPMSKGTVRAGNAMMIGNILQMPVQPYEEGKGVYRVVEVRGRQSGKVRQTPLGVLQYKRHLYLIAPSSRRDWVYNLMKARECVLLAQGQQEHYQATRTLDEDALALVRAYMAQLADWALQQFPFSKNASDEEVRSKEQDFAVFRLS